MASKQRYRKLSLGPSERITARNSCVGLVVLADYIDSLDAQRYLVLERLLPSAAAPPAKAPAKRKRAVKARQANTPPSAITQHEDAARGVVNG